MTRDYSGKEHDTVVVLAFLLTVKICTLIEG